MQQLPDKTEKILLSTEQEIFDQLVGVDHPFRTISALINMTELVEPLRECYSDLGRSGFDIESGYKALLIQFWENYSDRQMEKALKENIAIRWFCGFALTAATPDHTYFCKLRARLGTKRIADTFNAVNKTLENYGLFGNVFTFIDASAIITKTALWEERDRAIKDGETTLNNAVVKKYAADSQARWGAKGKNKIWFGHKRHDAVDMRFGLIRKTAITPANVPDFKAMKNVVPNGGMVFMDKIYDCQEVNRLLKANGCSAGTIRKNNNKTKDNDLDRWRSRIRMPFEGTFSKLARRARYRGVAKVALQNFLEATVHNMKKMVAVLARPPVMA